MQRFWRSDTREFARKALGRRYRATRRRHQLVAAPDSSQAAEHWRLHLGRVPGAPALDVVLGGKVYPAPHPGFRGLFDELFFYTSRYYATAERQLQELSGWPDFRLAGYRAQTLDADTRCVLAGLLSERPNQAIARQVISLVDAHRMGLPVARPLMRRYSCCIRNAQPLAGVVHKGDCEVEVLERMQNFLRRFSIPCGVADRSLLVSWRRLLPLADSPNPRVRQLFHGLVIELHQAGYRLGLPGKKV